MASDENVARAIVFGRRWCSDSELARGRPMTMRLANVSTAEPYARPRTPVAPVDGGSASPRTDAVRAASQEGGVRRRSAARPIPGSSRSGGAPARPEPDDADDGQGVDGEQADEQRAQRPVDRGRSLVTAPGGHQRRRHDRREGRGGRRRDAGGLQGVLERGGGW